LVEVFVVAALRHSSGWKPQTRRESITEALLVVDERDRNGLEATGSFAQLGELGEQFGAVDAFRVERHLSTACSGRAGLRAAPSGLGHPSVGRPTGVGPLLGPRCCALAGLR
jgi:hypothetical protein